MYCPAEICLCCGSHTFYIIERLSLILSLTRTQSIYRLCPEKIRCSQSDTGLSESVRETNIQPLQSSVCCRRPGVRIDAAEVLFSSLVSLLSVRGQHPETHTELKVIHLQHYRCIAVAGLTWVRDVCFDESHYIDQYLMLFFLMSFLQTSLPPLCSTSVDQWTICVLHGW